MQNDRQLAGEMAKCDGGGLEEEVDPTVQDWIERREEGTDHYITQFLTGHGPFVLKKNRESSGRDMQEE